MFLVGCHYNEEEISRRLRKTFIGYWPVQINGNKFATGRNLKKLVEVVKWRILAGWAQKSLEPWIVRVTLQSMNVFSWWKYDIFIKKS